MAEECQPQVESRDPSLQLPLRDATERVEGILRDLPADYDPPSQTDNTDLKSTAASNSKSNSLRDVGQIGTVEERRSTSGTQSRARGRSLLAEIAAENEIMRARPIPVGSEPTGAYDTKRRPHPRARRTIRNARFHISIDESSQNEEATETRSPDASSTSASTISPPYDEVQTPIDYRDEYVQSKDEATSPILIPGSASMSQTSSYRSMLSLGERQGSLRRMNRRSSTRVGSSSFSPAGAFLSQYRDEAMSQPEPDDEGQEIGDNSEYIIGRQIGFGGFSVVKEVYTIENDERVRRAVKIVRKQLKGQSEQANETVQTEFEHEVSIWRYLKHRYILPLHAVYETPFATFCIIKFSTCGTLFDLIRRQRKTASFIANNKNSVNTSPAISPRARLQTPLSHIKRYLYQIACALRYLHQDMRIVHRDLKLENCLLDIPPSPSLSHSVSSLSDSISSLASLTATEPTTDHPGDILVCDFGMADFYAREDRDTYGTASSTASAESPRSSTEFDGASASAPLDCLPAAATATDLRAAHNLGPGPASTNLTTSVNVAGSLQYAAPELLAASAPLYDTRVDMWAFGVLAFALVTAELPFAHGLAAKVQSRICAGDWDAQLLRECVGMAMRAEAEAAVAVADSGTRGLERADEEGEAAAALELVRGCLAMDPRRRWDAPRVLGCRFLARGPELYERGADP